MATELLDSDELTDYVKYQLSSLADLITDDGYELACLQTESELGWSYPLTDPTKILWSINRCTRHCLNILRIASANKFKFKVVNLQQRFEHFQKLMEDMDKDFEAALVSDAYLFSGVEVHKMFGTKIDAGFRYDDSGNDLTYDVATLVNFTPVEDDD